VSDPSGPSDDDAAEADLIQARAFQAAGNHTAALRAAEAALARNPVGRHAFDTLVVIAGVAYAQSDYARQIEIAGELLSRNPQRSEGHQYLTYAYIQTGDNVRAASAIAAGLARFPMSADLTQQEARRLAAIGDYKAAVAWAEKAVRLEPSSASYLTTLAWCLSSAEREHEARNKIVEALALDPLSAYVQSTAATIAYNQSRWDDCEAHAVQALTLEPNNTNFRSLANMARWFRHPLMKPFWRFMNFAGAFIVRQGMFALLLLFFAHVFFASFGALFVVPVFIVYVVVCMVVVSVLKRRAGRTRTVRLKDY
jgi:tetratricopeptide (TPR) repeat protein